MKSSYGIHEAKARFTELVRAAKSGRELVITDRGRPVARLIGIVEPKGLADRLLDLQAQGVLTGFPDAATADIKPLARRRGALARFFADR